MPKTPNLGLETSFVGIGPNAAEVLRANFLKLDDGETDFFYDFPGMGPTAAEALAINFRKIADGETDFIFDIPGLSKEALSDLQANFRIVEDGGELPPPPLPNNVVAPDISGAPRIGQPLTRIAGMWTSVVSVTWIWLRGTTAVQSGGASYLPVADDLGEGIKVRETGTNIAGQTATADSAATGNVIGAPAQMSPTDWGLETGLAEKQLVLTISVEPAANGSPVLGYEWSRDDGVTWSLLADGDSLGSRILTMATASLAYDIQVRAFNAVDGGQPSAKKTRTSGAASSGSSFYPDVPAVVTTTGGGSLRFPDGNDTPYTAKSNPTQKAAISQPAANMVVTGSTYASYFAVALSLPFDKRDSSANNVKFPICGLPGSSGQTFALRYVPENWGTSSQAGRFEFFLFGNGGTAITVYSEVPTFERILVVAGNLDGVGGWAVDLYDLDTGARLAGTVTTSSAINTANGIAAKGSWGIGTGSTATAFASNGGGDKWPGELRSLHYVRGGATTPLAVVTPEKWAAFALGATLQSQIPEFATCAYYAREYDPTTAFLAKPSWAVADLTQPCVPWSGTTGVPASKFEPGSVLRRQSTSEYLTIDGLSDGWVYGLTDDLTKRMVPFSGRAAGFAGNVEIQVFEPVSGRVVRDWTVAGAISGGLWSGQVELPRPQHGTWYVCRARPAASPTFIADRRQRFGVGYKFMIIGQSQVQISFGGGAISEGMSHPLSASRIVNDANVGIAFALRNKMDRIGAGTIESDGMVGFVNQFRKFDPITPICIHKEAINGTSHEMLVYGTGSTSDANNRSWSPQLTQKVARYGGDITAVLHNWGTADMAKSDFPALIEELFTGAATLAGINNLSQILSSATRFCLSPLTRHQGEPAYASNSNGAISSGVLLANARGWTVGLPMSDYRIENAGGPHADSSSPMGGRSLQARMAHMAARSLGLATDQNPYWSTAVVRAGNTLTITPVLPNGGSLTSPAATALRSWRVADGGVGDLLYTGFTAAIVAGKVVLTKTTGDWLPGTTLGLIQNGEPRPNNDGAAEQAICDGWCYESWAEDILGRGRPVVGSFSAGKWIPAFNAVAA